MKNPLLIIGVIVVVLIVSSVWYSNSEGQKNNAGVDTSKTFIKGNPEASITLVEYSDFQCPACAGFQPVLADVMNEFGNDIRFEYKHFPLPMHSLAEPAARAAEAAGQQDKFYEFHDVLFEKQKTWSNSSNPNALFTQYAEELGLDMQKFRRQMNASLLADKISDSKAEAKKLNVTATPTFFLNGEKMDLVSYEDFYQQIAQTVNPQVQFELPTISPPSP